MIVSERFLNCNSNIEQVTTSQGAAKCALSKPVRIPAVHENNAHFAMDESSLQVLSPSASFRPHKLLSLSIEIPEQEQVNVNDLSPVSSINPHGLHSPPFQDPNPSTPSYKVRIREAEAQNASLRQKLLNCARCKVNTFIGAVVLLFVLLTVVGVLTASGEHPDPNSASVVRTIESGEVLIQIPISSKDFVADILLSISNTVDQNFLDFNVVDSFGEFQFIAVTLENDGMLWEGLRGWLKDVGATTLAIWSIESVSLDEEPVCSSAFGQVDCR